MKFTNKDAKIRFYDGGQHTGATYSTTTVDNFDITCTGATFVEDEWIGKWIQITEGALNGYCYKITDNDTDTLTFATNMATAGYTTDTDFVLGGQHSYTVAGVGQSTGTSLTVTILGENWTANEWAGYRITMTSGAANGRSFLISSNTTNNLSIVGHLLTLGVVIGDTFVMGGTPYYFELCLDNGDFSGPIGIRKHEEILVLDRGLVGSCAHYINDNDVAIMEPLTISFTAMINDSAKFLEFMNMIEGTTVNGNTMVTTKGLSERITNGSPDLSFFDSTKKCYDIEYKMTGTTNSICYIFRECYFELGEQTYAEAEDGINLSISGMCYGTISRDSDWTDGIDVLG